jgi:hypothetical protein
MNSITSVTEKLSSTLNTKAAKISVGNPGHPPPSGGLNDSFSQQNYQQPNMSFDDSYINYGFSGMGRGAFRFPYPTKQMLNNDNSFS